MTKAGIKAGKGLALTLVSEIRDFLKTKGGTGHDY